MHELCESQRLATFDVMGLDVSCQLEVFTWSSLCTAAAPQLNSKLLPPLPRAAYSGTELGSELYNRVWPWAASFIFLRLL